MKSKVMLFAWIFAAVLSLPHRVTGADCPPDVPGKHGTLNNYYVPFNGDGHGGGISQKIIVHFKMFDDGRIEAPLTYENSSKEAFQGGVHIRLGDANNNSIAEFWSDPYRVGQPRPLISLDGTPVIANYDWHLRTTPSVACRYAHLFIEPNYNHPASGYTPATEISISSVRLSPSDTITAGNDVSLLIELSEPAASGGYVVAIDCNTTQGETDTLRTANDDPLITLVSATFDQGNRSSAILIKTKRVTDQPTVVTFRVHHGNSEKSATLTVR